MLFRSISDLSILHRYWFGIYLTFTISNSISGWKFLTRFIYFLPQITHCYKETSQAGIASLIISAVKNYRNNRMLWTCDAMGNDCLHNISLCLISNFFFYSSFNSMVSFLHFLPCSYVFVISSVTATPFSTLLFSLSPSCTSCTSIAHCILYRVV